MTGGTGTMTGGTGTGTMTGGTGTGTMTGGTSGTGSFTFTSQCYIIIYVKITPAALSIT